MNSKGYSYAAHFVTKDIFAFIVETNVGPVLWFMAPGLAGHSFIDYKKNSTSGNSGYNTPILSEDTIDSKYVGTLSCSEVFQRDFANSFCLVIDNKNDLDKNVKSAIRNVSLRIIKDHGELLTNANKDGSSQNEKITDGDYYTIAITMPGNSRNKSWITALILPGSQCVQYKDGTYEPLCFDNRHWHNTFATMGIFGPAPSTYGSSGAVNSNTSYAMALNYFSTDKYVECFPTSGGDNWIFEYNPKNVRVTEIRKIDKWTIGKYEGQGYDDRTSYMGWVKVGLWQIKGVVYFEDLPSGMGRFRGQGWSEFTAEFGYSESAGIYGAIKLTANTMSTRISSNSNNPRHPGSVGLMYYIDKKIPFKTSNGNYFIGSAAYVPHYNYTMWEDWYYSWLTAPEEIWQDTDTNVFSETILVNNNNIYIRLGNEIYTNALEDEDTVAIDYYYGNESTDKYTSIPNISYSDTELYLGFNNQLSITANTRDSDGNILFNLPKVNNQKFIENLTNIINISTTDIALFFEDNIIICSRVEDETFGYRYDYYPTKLSTGTRLGDSIINTIEGSYTIFPTKRGLAFMNYQAFMATTDQVLTYMTDPIEDRYDKFYEASETIKLVQMRDRLFVTNGTGDILIYDFSRAQWWFWQLPKGQFNYELPVKKLVTDQLSLYVVSHRLYKFGDYKRQYLDFENIENDIGEDSYLTPMPTKIDWFIVSQPLHLNAPNYYKNLKQLVFQLLGPEQDSNKHTIKVQIKCYRKKADVKEPELIEFTIDELRTFVKRFNYWKLCEVQYALADDSETQIPTQLQLNGIAVKYELGEEVR